MLSAQVRGALRIFHAALKAADPESAVREHLRCADGVIAAGRRRFPVSEFSRIYVIGAGKASAAMARAVERVLGRRIGGACLPGTLLALRGDLGAGKTRFVKGVAAGLGAAREEEVTSPTFVLMNLYSGRLVLAHFDLYRLDAVDLSALGFHDYRREAVIAMEWADKVDEGLLGDHLQISFEITGETSRRLMFQARGPGSRELLNRMNLFR